MLRHTKRPAPAWMQGCFGPFLLLIGVLGAGLIAFGGPLSVGDIAGLLVALVLAGVGASVVFEQWRKK